MGAGRREQVRSSTNNKKKLFLCGSSTFPVFFFSMPKVSKNHGNTSFGGVASMITPNAAMVVKLARLKIFCLRNFWAIAKVRDRVSVKS